jgi:hypothetical protein
LCRRSRLITRVGGFNDAVRLAKEVYRHFGAAEVVAVVNCAGGVVDTYALDPIVAGGASCMASIGRAVASIRPSCLVLFLVSARDAGDASVLSEIDVNRWQEMHDRCAADGVRLADWFIIDRHTVRSMAMSCASDADWSMRPGPEEET